MDNETASRERDRGMHRRFSLKRLLVSTTLIAAGLAAWGWSQRSVLHPDPTVSGLPIAVLYLAGGALCGAGILCLNKKTATGVLLGLVFSALIVAIMWRKSSCLPSN